MYFPQSFKKSLLISLFFCIVAFSEMVFSTVVDFETTPHPANVPSTFGRAGAAKIIDIDGVITFDGGVIIGFPTFLPTTDKITTPNLYGTAFHPSGGVVGHPTLRPSLSIDISSSLAVKTIEGVLLNGLNRPGSYTIEAFSNDTLVDSVSFNDLASNFSNGFETFRLDSDTPPITSVLFSPDLIDGEWDYFIDTIAINGPFSNVVPIPASIWFFVTAGLYLSSIRAKNSFKARRH